ncbi:N-acyl homoserine lactonase family protein [Streptomyces sp. CT34]|uniref:N-acyl homoserine lactonase family protein n=1 Tax=Streptomyces sp. CT34 TaxID=1553907 RepID=UPI0005BE83AA|nr:N-acyl homoserine lactonase family protein [Streptomyces sp. CT34]
MRLYLLRLGTVRPRGPLAEVPVPGYLIRHPGGTNILVDTGAARNMVGDESAAFAVGEDEHVSAQLGRLGLNAEDIDIVVCTHLHPDHSGSNDLFPQARFVVQRRELEEARASTEMKYTWMREHWDAPGLTYDQVDGDVELLPGVELIDSHGHSAGHQSVLVRLANSGPLLITGDAVPSADHTDPESRPVSDVFDHDGEAVRASTRKLMNLAARENALVVHSHDQQQWGTLRIAPEFYD